MQTIPQILAKELDKPSRPWKTLSPCWIRGNTIPFIARYRKELHGSMDDTALRTLEDRLAICGIWTTRRQEVKSAIDGQGKLTEELSAAIDTPPRWRRWRTCTAPISRSAAPAPPLPGRRGWSRWRSCCWHRQGLPRAGGGAHAYLDPEKGVETQGGCPAGRQRHHCRAAQRRRRPPQDPARPPVAAGTPAQPWPQGGGQRVPAVLRLRSAAAQAGGAPDPGRQPGRKGGLPLRDGAAGSGGGAGALRTAGGQAPHRRRRFVKPPARTPTTGSSTPRWSGRPALP